MKYCSCLTIQKRASARSVRIEDWVHRLALLTLAASGFYGSYLQAYQGAQIAPIGLDFWNPSIEGHTTISGGIGTFYDSVPLNVYAFNRYPEQIITNYLPDGTISRSSQHYLNLTSEAVASGSPLVDHDPQIWNLAPYTTAWNLQVQQRFSEHLTMRAKYVESHGSGLVTISPEVVQGQNSYVLGSDGRSRYRQFELTAQVSLDRPPSSTPPTSAASLKVRSMNQIPTWATSPRLSSSPICIPIEREISRTAFDVG